MTRDAFRRLALFAGATLYWLGIVVFAHYFGAVASIGCAVAGLLFGSLLTVELTGPPPESSGRFRRFGNPKPDEEEFELEVTDRA
jgi:hypothetical protein